MSETINWSFKVQIPGGPSQIFTGTLEADAYDKLEAEIAAGDTATLAVQPSAGAKFILITSSKYENLTYKVDGGAAITIDGPHILIGEGAAKLLSTNQQSFEFENTDAADITVNILVARDAA
jgi:hypothetical protein